MYKKSDFTIEKIGNMYRVVNINNGHMIDSCTTGLKLKTFAYTAYSNQSIASADLDRFIASQEFIHPEDTVEGEYYYITNGVEWRIKKAGREGSLSSHNWEKGVHLYIASTIQLKNWKNTWKCRKATKKEIAWLETCVSQGRAMSFEKFQSKTEKHPPSRGIKFSTHGKTYQYLGNHGEIGDLVQITNSYGTQIATIVEKGFSPKATVKLPPVVGPKTAFDSNSQRDVRVAAGVEPHRTDYHVSKLKRRSKIEKPTLAGRIVTFLFGDKNV